MKRILATTALVALTAVPAFAQTDTVAPESTDTEMTATETMDMTGPQVSADELIDRAVYVSNADAANGVIVDSIEAPADDWEEVGRVSDVIFTADGGIESVVLDVGGFFGIGAKEVSITMDDLTMVDEVGGEGEFFILFNGPAAELEERPELDRSVVNDEGNTFHSADNEAVASEVAGADDMTADTDMPEPMETDTDAAATDMDPVMGETDTAATDPAMTPVDEDVAEAPAAEGESMSLTGDERTALTADDLQGTNVHDMAGERVGSISDIVLSDDGQVDNVIVDVGGFLGIGAKSVAINFEDIDLTREDGAMTASLNATTTITADQFEAMEEWDG